jgi:hypothetical protein
VRIKDLKSDSLILKSSSSSSLKLDAPYIVSASTPLEFIDETKLRIMDKDSIFLKSSLVLDSISNSLVLDFDKTEKNKYKIQLLPGALTDFYGTQNDTLDYRITTKFQSDYGNVRISILNGVFPLIIQIVNTKGEVVESLLAEDSLTVDFNDVSPGVYFLRAIFDSNQNGMYDTGDYLKKIQPERVSYASEPIEVRAGWDTIEEFVLTD